MAKLPLTPKAHARLSPSGAKRWMACPGSLTLTAGIPDMPNAYSDDGTAIHEVAAWCLTEHYRAHKRVGEWIVVSAPGQLPERKVQFTKDMADLCQGYVDFVRAKAIGYELQVEQRLEFSRFVGEAPARAPGTLGPDDPGADGQFGTTDAGFVDWDQGEIVVDDLKSGMTPVEVERNPQLLTYGVAFLGKLYEDYQAAVARGEINDAEGWRQLRVHRHPPGVHAKQAAEVSDDGDIW